MLTGRIIKALSGFYYVQTEDGAIYECRGRGVFRKREITPLVGDYVKFEIDRLNKGYVKEIKERKNELERPPVANIDQALIVSSAAEPVYSQLLLDRFLVSVEGHHIQAIILISKIDLIDDSSRKSFEKVKQMYEKIGYPVLLISTKISNTLKDLEPYLANKTSVIAGQSGVGKSSILNSLNASLLIETAEISQSLGRGRHTTRHVELVEVSDGLVADTPGFSSLQFDHIEKETLDECFPEIKKEKQYCRFRGCMHDKEPHCAVKKAVENDIINKKRYEHYLSFLEEIKLRKPRY